MGRANKVLEQIEKANCGDIIAKQMCMKELVKYKVMVWARAKISNGLQYEVSDGKPSMDREEDGSDDGGGQTGSGQGRISGITAAK